MCEHCSSGEHLVDAAIEEGRIDASARETFIRTYESSPDLVIETLTAARPDTLRAGRNYFATIDEAGHEAYKREFASRHGIPVSEVI